MAAEAREQRVVQFSWVWGEERYGRLVFADMAVDPIREHHLLQPELHSRNCIVHALAGKIFSHEFKRINERFGYWIFFQSITPFFRSLPTSGHDFFLMFVVCVKPPLE